VITTLLYVRWRSVVNGLSRAPQHERMRAWLTPIWAALVVSAMAWAASMLFGPLFDETTAPARVRQLAERLPAFALMGAWGMLILSAMTVALQALYASRDVQLMLVAPIRSQAVFAAKLIDISLANVSLFAMMGLPILAAYAHARGILSIEYALRVALGMAAFCVLPTALGSIAAIVMMRLLPANRLRDIIGAMGLAGLASGYVILSLLARRMHEPGAAFGTARFMLDLLSSPAASMGPWAWAGDVVATPSGYPEAYEPLFLLVITSAAAVALGAYAASALYWRGWVGAQDAAGQRTTAQRNGVNWEGVFRWLPSPSRAYFIKDLRCLARDLRQLSLLLMPAAVVVVLLLNLGSDPQTHTAPRALLGLILLPLVGMIALRIASSAFVGETNSLIVALASPAGPRCILIGKLTYTAFLSSILAMLAHTGYAMIYAMSPGEWIVSLALTLMATVALSGIGIGVGARCMELSVEGAHSTLTGVARMLTLGMQLAYSAAVSLVVVAAWFLTHQVGLPDPLVYAVAGILAASISVVAIVVALHIGSSRLARLET